MVNISIYRAKKLESNEYVEGFYDQQKKWKTKCLKCNSLNTESYHEDYSEYSECFSCGEKSYFHNDNWLHDYQGETIHLIRDNGKYTEIDSSTLTIHFPDIINTNSEKVWYNMEEISSIIKEYEAGKQGMFGFDSCGNKVIGIQE